MCFRAFWSLELAPNELREIISGYPRDPIYRMFQNERFETFWSLEPETGFQMSSWRAFREALGILYAECSETGVSDHFGAGSRKLLQVNSRRTFREPIRNLCPERSKTSVSEHFGAGSRKLLQMSSRRAFREALGNLCTECSKTIVSEHFGAWSRKLFQMSSRRVFREPLRRAKENKAC